MTYEHAPKDGFGKLILAKDEDLFVTTHIARALGLLTEAGNDVEPLIKLLYGQTIVAPTETEHPGFVWLRNRDKTNSSTFLIPLLPEAICSHQLSKKTFQSILVTSDIVRDTNTFLTRRKHQTGSSRSDCTQTARLQTFGRICL